MRGGWTGQSPAQPPTPQGRGWVVHRSAEDLGDVESWVSWTCSLLTSAQVFDHAARAGLLRAQARYARFLSRPLVEVKHSFRLPRMGAGGKQLARVFISH